MWYLPPSFQALISSAVSCFVEIDDTKKEKMDTKISYEDGEKMNTREILENGSGSNC